MLRLSCGVRNQFKMLVNSLSYTHFSQVIHVVQHDGLHTAPLVFINAGRRDIFYRPLNSR